MARAPPRKVPTKPPKRQYTEPSALLTKESFSSFARHFSAYITRPDGKPAPPGWLVCKWDGQYVPSDAARAKSHCNALYHLQAVAKAVAGGGNGNARGGNGGAGADTSAQTELLAHTDYTQAQLLDMLVASGLAAGLNLTQLARFLDPSVVVLLKAYVDKAGATPTRRVLRSGVPGARELALDGVKEALKGHKYAGAMCDGSTSITHHHVSLVGVSDAAQEEYLVAADVQPLDTAGKGIARAVAQRLVDGISSVGMTADGSPTLVAWTADNEATNTGQRDGAVVHVPQLYGRAVDFHGDFMHSVHLVAEALVGAFSLAVEVVDAVRSLLFGVGTMGDAQVFRRRLWTAKNLRVSPFSGSETRFLPTLRALAACAEDNCKAMDAIADMRADVLAALQASVITPRAANSTNALLDRLRIDQLCSDKARAEVALAAHLTEDLIKLVVASQGRNTLTLSNMDALRELVSQVRLALCAGRACVGARACALAWPPWRGRACVWEIECAGAPRRARR